MATKGERNRDRILQTASNLIYRRGYGQTSFADIARSSGIPKGNFYYYYKVKDDLLRDVLRRRLENISCELDAWERSAPTPKTRLKRFVAMVRDNADNLSRYGCPIGSISTELGKDQKVMQLQARAMFDLYRDWLAQQWAGIESKPRAAEYADHLLAMAQGASLLGHVYGDPELIRRETLQMDRWLDAELPESGQ